MPGSAANPAVANDDGLKNLSKVDHIVAQTYADLDAQFCVWDGWFCSWHP